MSFLQNKIHKNWHFNNIRYDSTYTSLTLSILALSGIIFLVHSLWQLFGYKHLVANVQIFDVGWTWISFLLPAQSKFCSVINLIGFV
jgi:hypothetical protein